MERYRESWEDAPPSSWGCPIAALKALLLAGDDATEAAAWPLDAGAARAESPIGRYAGTLALLVLARDAEAQALAASLEGRDDFPRDVGAALAALAAGDGAAYRAAAESVATLLRDAHRLPRGRRGRRHRARPAGARPRRAGWAVELPASARLP